MLFCRVSDQKHQMDPKACNCSGCQSTITRGGIRIIFDPNRNIVGCGGCGQPWQCEDAIYCSKKCAEKHSYWLFMWSDKSVMVEDECNGCGSPIMFDADIAVQPIFK